MRLLLFLILLFAGLSCTENQVAAQTQTKVSPADFEARLAADTTIQLVDVRTPEEYAEGHLKGAQLMDYYKDDFSSQLETLDKSRPVYVYCRSGNRSGKTAVLLQEMGFKNIADLDGGIKAWQAAGKETEQ